MNKQAILIYSICAILFFTSLTLYGQSEKTLELPLKNGIVVSPAPYLYSNEKRGIYIKWTTDSLVQACAGGSVIHILNNSDSTFNITVSKKGGLSITYYGLSNINVKKGQSIQKEMVLGYLSKNSSLFIKVQNKRGLVNPHTVLDYKSE